MSNEALNQAILILRAEGCDRLSSIALRRYANLHGITDAWELAQAWLERD